MFSRFTMNRARVLFVSLTIFTLLVETLSLKEFVQYRVGYQTPLAVIKKLDSPTFQVQLAIAHEYQTNEMDDDYVGYYCDDSKTQFMTACPPYDDDKLLRLQENWRTSASLNQSKLFFLSKYRAPNAECLSSLVPSIRKFDHRNSEGGLTYCSRTPAEVYEIGYPISNDKGTELNFLSVYKICYSKVKGKEATLYSIHRIESPSLMFVDPISELPEFLPLQYHYESFLDSTLSTKKSFESKDYYAYQFVGIDDMVLRPWELTTKFLFNYTPITRNEDLFKGMIRTDSYIRLFSKKNNKPLTLYSGTYQKKINNNIGRIPIPFNSTLIDLFWRIIMDDDGQAIILVTQHSPNECGPEYLCEKDRQMKTYEKGGCIYTCSLNANDDLIKLLDLPSLNITGDLNFTFQTIETDRKSQSGQRPLGSDSNSAKKTNIIDFLNSATFRSAFRNVDPGIAENVRFRRPLD